MSDFDNKAFTGTPAENNQSIPASAASSGSKSPFAEQTVPPCNIPPRYIEKPKNVYTLRHFIFALLALVLGSFWYNCIFVFDLDVAEAVREKLPLLASSFPVTVFAVLFAVFGVGYFVSAKKKIGTESIFFLTMTLLYALRFSFFGMSDEMYGVAMLAIHLYALLFIASVGRTAPLCDSDIILNSVKAVFAAPFISFHTLAVSLFAPLKNRDAEKSKKNGLIAAYVLIGLAVSVPTVLIAASLLSSDVLFRDFTVDISRFLEDVFGDFRISDFINIITILVSAFLFGAFYSSENGKPAYKCGSQKGLSPIIANTVLISLAVLYSLYAAAQTGILTGKLPDGETYAIYARTGFFQLCEAAVVNGIVLYLAKLFTTDKGNPKLFTALCHVLCGFTLFVVAVNCAKMLLYISVYGFTPKRFYTLWMFALLLVLFVMVHIKLAKPGFNLSRTATVFVSVMLLVLFLVDFPSISDCLNARYGYEITSFAYYSSI